MKKQVLLFFLLAFGTLTAIGQATLSPEVLASAGATLSTANARLSFTLGETAIATLNTSNVSFGQGFHNGVLTVTPVGELQLAEWGVKVFPNPASQTVFVELNLPKIGETLSASLWDMQGRQLSPPTPLSGFAQNAVEVGGLPGGVYLLRLDDSRGRSAALRIVKAEQ